MLTVILFAVFIAFLFDFYNGMNDAANSIATIVSTRVLTPFQAVLWAAFFNFAAYFLFELKVAGTMGKGIVHADTVNELMVLASVMGGLVWVALCTFYGMPISVSHSLIGGLIGSAVAKEGWSGVILESGGSFFQSKIFLIIIFIVLAPLLGMLIGYLLMVLTYWIFRRTTPMKADFIFRILQLVSSAAYSLGHGSNDAQKTMGVITILLFSVRDHEFVKQYLFPYDEFHVPPWVAISCYIVISLGTLIGGWRVVRTLGIRLTHLRPQGGFCAETGGALTLFGTAIAGIPVSTTHTITGGIMGVGMTRRLSAVKWGVAGNILMAWVLTIPASAIVAGITYYIISWLAAG
jgi:PiT family inorganic phosphate transporter